MSAVPEQVRLDLEELDTPRPIAGHSVKTEEITLPNNLGIFLILFGIIAISSFVFYLSQSDTLPIKQVTVGGDFRNLSPVKLQELISDRVKAGFFNLNVQDVRDAVIDEAWVDDVIVQRVWPDKVHVIITEKVPVVRWQEDGFLTQTAVLFRPEANNISSDLAQLFGPENSESTVLKNYQTLSEQLSEWGLTVEEMILDERRSWSFQLANGPQVIIGRENYAERIQRLMFWLPTYLLDKLERIEVIDLRYTNGFSVRWQSDSK